MENQDKYSNYSVQDFICDEHFQDWVLRPEAQESGFWDTWLQHNPAKKAVVAEARMVLESLAFREDQPEEGKPERALQKAWQMIDGLEQEEQPRRGVLHRLSRIGRMAAAWIVLLGAGLLIWLLTVHRVRSIQVATTFGQLDSVLLPDRSSVVLNASSSIRYRQQWKQNAPREVWLKGEALFNVQHLNRDNKIKPYERFLVHVGNTTIEVLGTTFNIRQRREKIAVALLSGSVRIHFENNARGDIQMIPGDLVVLDTLYTDITKTRTNAKDYAAWTRKRLVLTNPSLQEITNYLEDVYGKKIVLSDPRLASRKVEGPILLDSLDDALFVLSTVLNLNIVKEEDTIIIRPR